MGSSLRLMTANLLGERADPDSLAGVIDRQMPDLVVLQEMGPEVVDVITDRYDHHHLHPSPGHDGYGIASRLDAVLDSRPLPWRWIAWARLEIDARSLVVASTHLRNPVSFPWWKSVRLRGEQLEALSAWAEGEVGDDPFVLAGDMNATPAWPVYRRLSEGWQDLVLAEAERSGGTPAPTWGWRPGWPRLLRIDHVFGSSVRVVGTSIEAVRGSDHAAVVVDLELE